MRYRTWGKQPYGVAVIHGGPGAPGSVAPVARELATFTGVLEPFQTETTVEGQIQELHDVLQDQADLPAVLVGHSWGAWLAYLVASRHPILVQKLILVGSGAFQERYATNIVPERLKRLSEEKRIEVLNVMDVVNGDAAGDKDRSLARLGELFAEADTYDGLPPETGAGSLEVSEEINRKVWSEASDLRISGKLLDMGKGIRCPVVVIHGDYDPTPAEGVEKPLRSILKDFRFILLERCGHEPWTERYARDEFFRVLRREIT